MNESTDEERDRQQNAAMAASQGNGPIDGDSTEGVGTPEGGPETGIGGTTRTSAPPGETDGYGAELSPGGLTGGYGTGGVTPEEQAEEGQSSS